MEFAKRVLIIYGDDDFGVINFDDDQAFTEKSIVEYMDENGLSSYKEDGWNAKIKEFEHPVAKDVFDWFKEEFQDYDDSKNKDFFPIYEDGWQSFKSNN